MSIRLATEDDAERIAAIYNHYIRSTVITFETVELTAADMAARIGKLAALGLPWLVATDDADAPLGYAYAGPFRERAAYVHSLETSIYLDQAATRSGIGTALYTELIARLRAATPPACAVAPVHALLAGVALPNEASVALHERLGFTKIGHFTEVGRKFDRWVDVGYWQLSLDA